MGVDAVEALLEDGALARADIAGPDTALVYVTAAAYGASNRAFVEGGGGALHFPYTAPSAVPAEVAIEYGLHGPYAVLIGGAATTIDALDHAATLLARGMCARALVLAVETFAECETLFARGRWLLERPLVEAAAAVLLEGETHPAASPFQPVTFASDFAYGPLIALAQARARDGAEVTVGGRWRGRETALTLGVMAAGAGARS
jgi:3-oxoacyl-[acyl-carrier-protein] synthase III